MATDTYSIAEKPLSKCCLKFRQHFWTVA